MNDNNNHIYSQIEKNIIQIIIQKLTFAPSISLYRMAKIAVELDIGKEAYDELLAKDDKDIFQNQINVAYQRFNHILSCFSKEKNGNNDKTKPTRRAKIYDDRLKEKQLSIYDSVAQRAGFPTAEKAGLPLFEGILPFSTVRAVCNLDKGACPNMVFKKRRCDKCSNCEHCNHIKKCEKCLKCKEQNNCENCYISTLTYDNIDHDLLAIYAPYYYHGERDGLNFIEHIIFQAIFFTKWHRDIVKLDNIVHSSVSNAEKSLWLAPVLEKMDSVEIYKACVDTFFEIFYDYVSDKYEELAEEYIRTLLLPEQYAERKDAFTAAEKYGEDQLSMIIDRGNWCDINRAFKLWNATDDVQYLIFQIMPHVWKTLINECDKKNLKKRKTEFAYGCADSDERDTVAFYCRLIKSYIHDSIRDAKIVLRESLKRS